LTETELDQAVEDAQKADETRLVRRLCFVKNLYHGDTRMEAGDRVGISKSTTGRWAAHGTMEVLKGSDHASAAVGRRSSLLYSLMNYVILLKLTNRGHHSKFTYLSKTATMSRIIRHI